MIKEPIIIVKNYLKKTHIKSISVDYAELPICKSKKRKRPFTLQTLRENINYYTRSVWSAKGLFRFIKRNCNPAICQTDQFQIFLNSYVPLPQYWQQTSKIQGFLIP